MKPEDISLEHMSVQEAIDDMRRITWRGRLRRRYRRLKYAAKTQINLWILRRESKHENPSNGAQEVIRLRKMLVVEPTPVKQIWD